MKILVIGKSGQLARELSQLSSADHDIVCLGRNDIDITSLSSIAKVLGLYKFEGVINASAYTTVDKAETDLDNAYALNAIAVGHLAEACKIAAIGLVHVSTDFVFGGDKNSAYLPSDDIKPLSVYGASKAVGEKRIAEIYPEKSAIIRTSWLYSIHGHNFVKTILNLLKEQQTLNVINDQIGSPTYAKGLAIVCLEALKYRVTGIHHYTDKGITNWYDFAVAIQNIAFELGLLDKKIPIKPITTAEYPTPAARPSYSVLDKSSLALALPNVSLTHWQTQLYNMLVELKASQNTLKK